MHRRPDLYGMDAELFRPERWDEDMPLNQTAVNAKWGYLPFNGGPRVCLGSKYFPIRLTSEYHPTILTTFRSGFRPHRSRLHHRANCAEISDNQAAERRSRGIDRSRKADNDSCHVGYGRL